MIGDPSRMEALAAEATGLLKALAHPARLMICCRLREGEMSVGALEEAVGVRQPRLSRELGKLREEGLVGTRRESKVIFYRLADDRAAAMVDAICAVMLGENGRPHGRGATHSRRPPASGGYGVFARTGLDV